MTRRGRVARIQRCIKDNNTLYRNEISTLRRLMPADIHDTVSCTKRPPLSQHNVSSEILYGAERSLTILIFSSFGRTLYLKFDRFDRSRVLSRALLSRKYPIFEREGGRGKKKKRKKIAMKRRSIFNTKLVSTLFGSLPLFLPGPPAWERSFFFPFVAERPSETTRENT